MRKFILSVMAIAFSIVSMGARNLEPDTLSSLPRALWHIGAGVGLDYVASSVEDDVREKIPAEDKIRVNSSLPVNLRVGFKFTNPKIRNYLPGGYQGISVGVLNLGALEPKGSGKAYRNIGYPVLAYLYQGGPFWHFRNDLSLNYEWNFGAAIGWKPFSEQNKYFNLTVGSQVNAYLNLNMTLQWQMNPAMALFAGIGVSHFSNGNTSFPNPGVNSFGLRMGIVCSLNSKDKDSDALLKERWLAYEAMDTTQTKKTLEYDITLWGSTRKRVYRGGESPVLLPGHFACAGIGFAPMVSLGKWWRVGGSLDLQYDHSAGMPRIDKNIESPEISDKENSTVGADNNPLYATTDKLPGHPSFWHQVSVGISAHGELQMPVFAVNVGIGYNLVAPWENKGFYQNITLKTYLCKEVFLNVGYQLRNFHQQSSLMLGVGFTFS